MPSFPSIMQKKPSAIGSYIFAGGMSVGTQKHFTVLCHLEEGDYGVKTAKHNFPNLPIHVGFDNWPLSSLAGKVDYVYGNPPCAAWSCAGYTKTKGTDKWKTDPRVACTQKHFTLIEELNPLVWSWESVTQAYSKGWDFVQSLTIRAGELGYSTSYILHDSQYLGLPQVRRRFFMVCHRIEFKPIIPDFTRKVTPIEVLKMCKKPGDPCWGQGRTEARWTAEKIAKIEPGERLSRHWEKNYAQGDDKSKWERNPNGTIKGRPSFGHCRLPLDRPGGAVVGYALIHPTEHRFISTEEMQMLCGYPESFHFTPKAPGARSSEIARGVCPPVGAWLAEAVAQAVYSPQKITQPTVTLWDFRKPNIPPMDLTAVLDEEGIWEAPVSEEVSLESESD